MVHSSIGEDVPDKRGYPAHVVSYEERRPCYPILQGNLFLSHFRFIFGAHFFLDQKDLRTGQLILNTYSPSDYRLDNVGNENSQDWPQHGATVRCSQ